MTNLFKLIETSKTLSLIFDFLDKNDKNKRQHVLIIIFRVILLLAIGIFALFLHIAIYILYLWMFFTSIPGKLVKKIRMDSLGFDNSNKWLFNLSYLLLYIFVLPFEFTYIFVNYSTVVLSFFTDCLTWILTFGKTKLTNTNLSINDQDTVNPDIQNKDIISILVTVLSVFAFITFIGGLYALDSFVLQWLASSVIALGISGLYYYLFCFRKNKTKVEQKSAENAAI